MRDTFPRRSADRSVALHTQIDHGWAYRHAYDRERYGIYNIHMTLHLWTAEETSLRGECRDYLGWNT